MLKNGLSRYFTVAGGIIVACSTVLHDPTMIPAQISTSIEASPAFMQQVRTNLSQ